MDSGGEIVTAHLASFATGDPDVAAACATDDFVNEHLAAAHRSV